MITAAALCPWPPALVRELTGSDPVLPELRRACATAVSRLAGGDPELVVVVGPAAVTGTWDAASRLQVASLAPLAGSGGTAALPLSLGLGAWLLDQAGYRGRRALQAVGYDEPASSCVQLGRQLRDSGQRTALLVLADGSARRTPRAPGHYDERALAFDREVQAAIAAGDFARLRAVDQDLARELMATGRPGWQVMAGALDDDTSRAPASTTGSNTGPSADILYQDDPFGVAYLVAFIDPAGN